MQQGTLASREALGFFGAQAAQCFLLQRLASMALSAKDT